jgi:hypothetical protein
MVNWLAGVLAGVGRLQDLVVMEPGSAFFNLLKNPFLNASQVAELLINCANHFGRSTGSTFRTDGKYWELANRNWLTTIIEVLQARQRSLPTLAELIRTKTEMRDCPHDRLEAGQLLQLFRISRPLNRDL